MSKSSSKVLLASLFGVAVGVGIGMLIAPAKGSKTRKRLKKKIMAAADIMQDDLTDKLSALQSVFSEEEEEDEEGPAEKSPNNQESVTK
jgi:gas vesicle protein